MRGIPFFSVLLPLILVASPCLAIDPVEFAEIRDVSVDILKRFPPDKYVYVGVGASPTPMMRFMESTHPGSSMELPLSGAYRIDMKAFQTPENMGRLQRHFDRFLPTAEQLGGRKVLLIDYAVGGGSLESSLGAVSRHYTAAGKGVQVEAVGLVGKTHSAEAIKLFEGKKIPMVNLPEGLEAKLNANAYKDFQRWGSYNFATQETTAVVESPVWKRFGADIEKQVGADSAKIAAELPGWKPPALKAGFAPGSCAGQLEAVIPRLLQ